MCSVDCGFKMVQVHVLHPHLIKSLRTVDKPSKSIYIYTYVYVLNKKLGEPYYEYHLKNVLPHTVNAFWIILG